MTRLALSSPPPPAAATPVAAAPPHAAPGGAAVADRLPTWALAAAAVVLSALGTWRAGVELLAWAAPVPLAVAAVRLRGVRGRALLWLLSAAAATLPALKIATPPVPYAFALAYGVPLGTLAFATLVAWDAVRRRVSAGWGIHALAGLTVLADVAGVALTPAGHWASVAANHSGNLPLLQVASLGGLGLVALAVAWPAGAAAVLLLTPAASRPWRHAAVAAAATAAALVFGTFRVARAGDAPTVRVAAVTVDFPSPLTSMEQLRGAEDVLFERSERAVERGAQVVVWNEVATLVDPGEEPALAARAAAFARARRVDLVAAYGVLRARAPLRYENVYRWFGPDGAEVERYDKHFLPLGEAAVPGTAPLRAHDRPWGRAAGALCYDYDSPALARAHAREGADVVLLPSSDWRGIDPQHTEMARVRAIEGGFSILRAVRAATSAAIDPQGRFRATLSPWEENDRVLVATLPARQVRTLYATVGDAPAVAAGLALVAGGLAARRRERRRDVSRPAA